MTDLEPCPLCGGKVRIMMVDHAGREITRETYENNHDEGQTYDEWLNLVLAYHVAICNECSVYMPGWVEEGAVDKWNKRVVE